MKLIFIATAVTAALLAPQAFAQANQFTGFGLALNVNTTTTATELTDRVALMKVGESAQNASLQGSYGFLMGSNAVLGLGVSAGLGELKAGTFTSAGSSFEMKGKDMYSVYIEPGMAVGNSALVYAKLAYLGMKQEIAGAGTTINENFDGTGIGAGIRAKLDKNLFLQVEFAYSSYSSKTVQGATFKPTSSTGTIGIGYLF